MKMYKETDQYGVVSAVVGSIGMLAWLIPLIGIFITIFAILVGFYAYDPDDNGFAIAGITLGVMGLLLTIIRSGMVYYYG